MIDTHDQNAHALDSLEQLLTPIGLSSKDVGGQVSISGSDPLFPSAIRMGEAFSVAAMASAVGSAAIWRERTGENQDLSVDMRRAAHGINPDLTFHPTINGHPYPNWVGNFHPFGIVPFLSRDNRWVYPSAVYPNQQAKWGNFFNCGTDFHHISEAISKWDAIELEDAANAAGQTLCMARTSDEWQSHPQGKYLSAEPVISVRKIGDSAPEPFKPAARPLSGINVLSLTHAIAGPVVGRTLAEQGANVLCVNDHGFEHDWVYDDANVGQRSAFLDLNNSADNQRCHELIKDADVFVDSFRSRKMSTFGFSPEELTEIRPGIIVVNVRCYGWDGPWSDRGGFDMLGSAASGLALVDSPDGVAALPPTGMLNDFITGYLGAAGVSAALLKRSREGGSYHVTVSLTRTAMWALSLGLIPEADQIGLNPMLQLPTLINSPIAAELASQKLPAMLARLTEKLLPPDELIRSTPLGQLRRLAPAITNSKSPAYWRDPLLVPRGSSQPYWA